MGEIRNIIVFFILLSRKLQFYNNLFFLLLEIFVETHFTFLCSDVLNTIFLKNGIDLLHNADSRILVVRQRCNPPY
jgi:hypothetical protein